MRALAPAQPPLGRKPTATSGEEPEPTMRTLLKLLLTIGLIMTLSDDARAGDPENTLVMEIEGTARSSSRCCRTWPPSTWRGSRN